MNCFAHEAGAVLVNLAERFAHAAARGEHAQAEKWAAAAFALRGDYDFVDADPGS